MESILGLLISLKIPALIVGELIVAQEVTLAAAVSNIKPLLALCYDRLVFIVAPMDLISIKTPNPKCRLFLKIF